MIVACGAILLKLARGQTTPMYAAYPAKFKLDGDDAYLVTFPDVPAAITDLATEDKRTRKGARRAAEALTLALSIYVERGEPLPVPSAPKRGQILIPLSGDVVAKLAVYEAMRKQQLSRGALARRMRVRPQMVTQIVDPCSATRFEVLEAALDALGLQAKVSIEPAAAC